MSSCRTSIERFLNRDVVRWEAWDAECTVADVTSWYSFVEGHGLVYRGRENVAYQYRVLVHPSFPDDVTFYFDSTRLCLMGTEVWSYNRHECEETLARLGEPERSLDFYWRDQVVQGGLNLYLGKGMSVGVIHATQIIASLEVFSPCSLTDYMERYHETSLAREFPR